MHQNGTEIMKKINGNNVYQGAVTSHNEETDLYRINYADGDWEEMNQRQVSKFRCLDTVKDRMKRFTQSSILQHLANKTTRSTTDTDTDTDTVPLPLPLPLPPHYAMVVFDEQSGKMLDYRQLINHLDPAIRKIWQYSVSNEFGVSSE
jgi:hypothetical protein